MRTVDTIGGKQSPSNQAAANLQAPVNATPITGARNGHSPKRGRGRGKEGRKEGRKQSSKVVMHINALGKL